MYKSGKSQFQGQTFWGKGFSSVGEEIRGLPKEFQGTCFKDFDSDLAEIEGEGKFSIRYVKGTETRNICLRIGSETPLFEEIKKYKGQDNNLVRELISKHLVAVLTAQGVFQRTSIEYGVSNKVLSVQSGSPGQEGEVGENKVRVSRGKSWKNRTLKMQLTYLAREEKVLRMFEKSQDQFSDQEYRIEDKGRGMPALIKKRTARIEVSAQEKEIYDDEEIKDGLEWLGKASSFLEHGENEELVLQAMSKQERLSLKIDTFVQETRLIHQNYLPKIEKMMQSIKERYVAYKDLEQNYLRMVQDLKSKGHKVFENWDFIQEEEDTFKMMELSFDLSKYILEEENLLYSLYFLRDKNRGNPFLKQIFSDILEIVKEEDKRKFVDPEFKRMVAQYFMERIYKSGENRLIDLQRRFQENTRLEERMCRKHFFITKGQMREYQQELLQDWNNLKDNLIRNLNFLDQKAESVMFEDSAHSQTLSRQFQECYQEYENLRSTSPLEQIDPLGALKDISEEERSLFSLSQLNKKAEMFCLEEKERLRLLQEEEEEMKANLQMQFLKQDREEDLFLEDLEERSILLEKNFDQMGLNVSEIRDFRKNGIMKFRQMMEMIRKKRSMFERESSQYILDFEKDSQNRSSQDFQESFVNLKKNLSLLMKRYSLLQDSEHLVLGMRFPRQLRMNMINVYRIHGNFLFEESQQYFKNLEERLRTFEAILSNQK